MKGRRLYDDGGVVANTILEQLGGAGRLRMMTGAYNFYDLGNGLSFKIKNQRANYIKITLTPMDLYDVEVGRIRGNTYKVVQKGEGLYFDQLKPFIEKATGMYLSLFGMGGMVEHKTEDGETLKYKIDTDEMSVEVDYPTMEYLSENGIVMKMEARKLKDTYIFWYDQIANASKEELEEVLDVELPVYLRDDDYDDYERDEYAKGGGISDAAYKRRMKMFGHKPYGATKGKFKVTYNADGEPQTEIWDTMEMAKDTAKRYSRMDEFSDVKIFDESGKEIQFMEKGGEVYQLGDMWSDDFDYNGMLRMGLKAETSWGSKKLRKLFDSYEDVNYHTASKNLWNAIQALNKAEEVQSQDAKKAYILAADNYIEQFHDDVLEEMLSYRRGGKVKDKWIQDALAGKKGTLRATAKRKGLIRGDEKLSKTDLKKLEKMGGKTAKRAYLAETLSKFSDGGMTVGRWYKDNTGEEFRYIGKIDSGVDKGKLLFSDGTKSFYKSLDEFGSKPKENKLFGFFAKGGNTLDYDKISSVEVENIDMNDAPDFVDAYISYAEYDGEPMTEEQLEMLNYDSDFVYSAVERRLYADGGDIEDYKRWERRYDMLSELYEDADADDRKKIQKEMDELESKMHKSERDYANGGKTKNKYQIASDYWRQIEESMTPKQKVLYKKAYKRLEDKFDQFNDRQIAEYIQGSINEYYNDSFKLTHYEISGVNWFKLGYKYIAHNDAINEPEWWESNYAKGGKVKKKRVRFVDKVESIADRLEGKKVPKSLKKDYGGRYNREEAEEAGRRIAGAQLRDRKMMSDGGVAKEKIKIKSYNIHEQEIGSGDVVIDYENETIKVPSGKVFKVVPDREYTVKFQKKQIKANGGINGLVQFIKEINNPDSPFNPSYTSLIIEL